MSLSQDPALNLSSSVDGHVHFISPGLTHVLRSTSGRIMAAAKLAWSRRWGSQKFPRGLTCNSHKMELVVIAEVPLASAKADVIDLGPWICKPVMMMN
jgi:hypothetical protein